MTMNTQQSSGTESTHIPLGAKLQSARESISMGRKDAAAQLRLNENVIDMMENNSFPVDMPHIFVRGYLRSYGKLLQIPEEVIQAGLEPIKQNTVAQETRLPSPVTQMEPAKGRNHLMKVVTAAVVVTLFWMVSAWWHSHSPAPEATAVEVPAETQTANLNTLNTLPAGVSVQLNQPALPPLAVAATAQSRTAMIDTSPLSNLPIAPAGHANSTAAISDKPVEAPKTTSAAPVPAYKRAAMANESPITDQTNNDNDMASD